VTPRRFARRLFALVCGYGACDAGAAKLPAARCSACRCRVGPALPSLASECSSFLSCSRRTALRLRAPHTRLPYAPRTLTYRRHLHPLHTPPPYPLAVTAFPRRCLLPGIPTFTPTCCGAFACAATLRTPAGWLAAATAVPSPALTARDFGALLTGSADFGPPGALAHWRATAGNMPFFRPAQAVRATFGSTAIRYLPTFNAIPCHLGTLVHTAPTCWDTSIPRCCAPARAFAVRFTSPQKLPPVSHEHLHRRCYLSGSG